MSPTVYFSVIDDIDRHHRSAAGKSFVLQAISRAAGEDNLNFHISHEPGGKPYVTGHSEIFISLSHSRTSLACAATLLGPVGIDIEIVRPHRDLAGIAAFAFGPNERIRSGSSGADGFYRIWTLREAMAKAEGIGLARAADRQDRVDSGPDTGDWRWQDWHLSHRILAPGKHLALAAQAPAADGVEWRYFTLNAL